MPEDVRPETSPQDGRRLHERLPAARRFALDETDGRAARAFNQTSTFGTVLDMVTDRWRPLRAWAAGLGKGTRLISPVTSPWRRSEAACAAHLFPPCRRRVATSGLLMVLCIVYPGALLLFQLLLILDIFSHWLQMYAASLTGVTHKVRQLSLPNLPPGVRQPSWPTSHTCSHHLAPWSRRHSPRQ